MFHIMSCMCFKCHIFIILTLIVQSIKNLASTTTIENFELPCSGLNQVNFISNNFIETLSKKYALKCFLLATGGFSRQAAPLRTGTVSAVFTRRPWSALQTWQTLWSRTLHWAWRTLGALLPLLARLARAPDEAVGALGSWHPGGAFDARWTLV